MLPLTLYRDCDIALSEINFSERDPTVEFVIVRSTDACHKQKMLAFVVKILLITQDIGFTVFAFNAFN